MTSVTKKVTGVGSEGTRVAFLLTRVGSEAAAVAQKVTRVPFLPASAGSEATGVGSEVTRVIFEVGVDYDLVEYRFCEVTKKAGQYYPA